MRGQRTSPLTPLDRFNAFSDGVFAIAITILVLELPVPEGNAHIWQSLADSWPSFLGYFVSFSIIGGVWIQHASMTKWMKAGDTPSYVLNLLLLLFTGLIPFSTRLFVSHIFEDQVSVAVLVYGINMLLATVTLSLLMIYVSKTPDLLSVEVADDELRELYRGRWISIGVNVVALALVVIAPLVAIFLYLLQSLLLMAIPLLTMRRKRAAAQQ